MRPIWLLKPSLKPGLCIDNENASPLLAVGETPAPLKKRDKDRELPASELGAEVTRGDSSSSSMNVRMRVNFWGDTLPEKAEGDSATDSSTSSTSERCGEGDGGARIGLL